MQNITIGRYTDDTGRVYHDENGVERIEKTHDGWIEGTRDDGSTWIMWLDAVGSPQCFWGRRDEQGGVIGDPIVLDQSE